MMQMLILWCVYDAEWICIGGLVEEENLMNVPYDWLYRFLGIMILLV